MADANRCQLHGRLGFNPANNLAQMPFKIASRIDRQSAVIDGCSIRNHHQNAAVFCARKQPVMRPDQRLAIDILFQQPLAHHQAQIAPSAPPRFIGLLIKDMTQIIEPAGLCWLAISEPRFARLAAFPCAGGKAKDLCLDPAPLQCARENISADRRD